MERRERPSGAQKKATDVMPAMPGFLGMSGGEPQRVPQGQGRLEHVSQPLTQPSPSYRPDHQSEHRMATTLPLQEKVWLRAQQKTKLQQQSQDQRAIQLPFQLQPKPQPKPQNKIQPKSPPPAAFQSQPQSYSQAKPQAKSQEQPRDKHAKSYLGLKLSAIWLQLALKLLAIIIVVLLLFTFVFGMFRVEDHGMHPSVKAGDLVMYFRLDRAYIPQDLCVIKRKGNTQVVRVLAKSGDKVDITEQGLLINGAIMQEADIKGITRQFEEGVSFPLTVPEGEIFVLGDNRPKAEDSRIFGPIKVRDTLGTVMLVLRRRNF